MIMRNIYYYDNMENCKNSKNSKTCQKLKRNSSLVKY